MASLFLEQHSAKGMVLGMVGGVDASASLMAAIAGTHIQGGIGASPEEYIWTMTVYAGDATVMNIALSQIGHRIGFRRFMLYGLVVLMLGSLACGLAQNVPALVAGRVIQGIGVGGLFSAARIFAQIGYEPVDRAPVMNGFGFGMTLCSAVAAWLTAWLVDQTECRAVFLLLAAVALPRHVHWPADAEIGEPDWHSMFAFAVGVLLLLHGLAELRYIRAMTILL